MHVRFNRLELVCTQTHPNALRAHQPSNPPTPVFAGVTPADELCNIGRVAPGDVLFVHRNAISVTSAVRMNQRQQEQVTTSVSMPHARVQRVAGLDFVNRSLGASNYQANHTILVNSLNPCDEWRSLSFLNDWTLDGIVMSDDSPGYMLSSGTGARNDRLFNVAIQGPAQVNNGFEDEAGRGLAARHDRSIRLSGGRMPTAGVEREIGRDSQNRPFMARDSAAMQQIMANAQAGNDIKDLVAGPFYDQYPLQMFDRKIRPMSELFIGLVCKEVSRTNANGTDNPDNIAFLNGIPDSVFEEYENPADGVRGKYKGDGVTPNVDRIHIFKFIPFSSRQAWQYAEEPGNPGAPDRGIVDNSSLPRNPGDGVGGTGESEPASRRRGPNDPKRGRDPIQFMPRKQQAGDYWKEDNFIGLKQIELANMVGAWRLGRVLDVASSRKEGYSGGPIDTAFRVTLNVDLSFLDWRALRRGLGIPWIGSTSLNCPEWSDDLADDGTYVDDDGRVMQWPTDFQIWNNANRPAAQNDTNIPIAPFDIERLNPPGNAARRGDRMNSNPSSTYGEGRIDSGAVFGGDSIDATAKRAEVRQRLEYMNDLIGRNRIASLAAGGLPPGPGAAAVRNARIQAPAAGGSDGGASQAVVPPAGVCASAASTQPTQPTQPTAAPLLGSLSFPEQAAQREATATGDAASKAAGKAKAPKTAPPPPPPPDPMEEEEEEEDYTAAPPPPKPVSKPVSKEKRPASAAVGEDVMASIFGSSASSEPTDNSAAAQPSDERPKNFPRRNRDR